MYRHNKLYEELDKLRSENDYCKREIRYLNEKLARRDLEIQNLRLQLQVKDLSFKLCQISKDTPIVFKAINDTLSEPFKTGLDTGILKDKQVYTTSEIVNNNELYRKMYHDMGIPKDVIDEIFNNKK